MYVCVCGGGGSCVRVNIGLRDNKLYYSFIFEYACYSPWLWCSIVTVCASLSFYLLLWDVYYITSGKLGVICIFKLKQLNSCIEKSGYMWSIYYTAGKKCEENWWLDKVERFHPIAVIKDLHAQSAFGTEMQWFIKMNSPIKPPS